jgi:hypothetical protein
LCVFCVFVCFGVIATKKVSFSRESTVFGFPQHSVYWRFEAASTKCT